MASTVHFLCTAPLGLVLKTQVRFMIQVYLHECCWLVVETERIFDIEHSCSCVTLMQHCINIGLLHDSHVSNYLMNEWLCYCKAPMPRAQLS